MENDSKLFDKALVFTDIHFGKKNDSQQHNEDCLEFVRWVRGRIEFHRPDLIIISGDWFDNRTRIRLDTANYYSKLAMDVLVQTGIPIIIIVGNHDMYYRDSRKIHSLGYFSSYPNVTLIEEITMIGGCLFCPWLVKDEFAATVAVESVYVFGHFELPTFLFNHMIEVPDHGGLHPDHFEKTHAVFSGHLHKRQVKRNRQGIPIWYIGNAFPHDFNDVHDTDRGVMILEWGKEPRFEDWPDQPTFHREKMSRIIELIESDTLATFYNKRATIQATNDLGIPDVDLNGLVEHVSEQVRGFRLLPTGVSQLPTLTDIGDVANKDINLFVEEQIGKLDTQGRYENDLLVRLFNEAE